MMMANNTTQSQSNNAEIEYHGEGFDKSQILADEEFSSLLNHKFSLLKQLLIASLGNPHPKICLNKEHICRILK